MILHTVNKSPFRHQALADCLAVAEPGDGLILLEDGVYALLDDQCWRGRQALQIFALEGDIASRGLSERLPSVVEQIDYDRFVALTLHYTRVQSWY